MTQEDKELLLKDLSDRLPYGVFCVGITYDLDDDGEKYIPVKVKDTLTEVHNYKLETASVRLGLISSCRLETIKPYLRSMPSMTEEERQEYLAECDKDDEDSITTPRYHGIDWLNKKMFDYRGLIPMGLALDAPNDMYKI